MSLAAALKNAAIYPLTHPRVATAAEAAVEQLRAHASKQGQVDVAVNEEGVAVAGTMIPDNTPGAQWLAQRLRDVGLRGIEFAADCTMVDVSEFAALLNGCRGRDRATLLSQWPKGHARLRPLQLMFTGRYSADGESSEVTNSSAPPREADAGTGGERRRQHRPHVQAVLDRLSADTDVQQRLLAIEQNCVDPANVTERQIDLLDAIADLMPADVSNDPHQIEEAVKGILARVEVQLGEIVRRNAKVKGADLLRKALAVAPKYFKTKATQQTVRKDLPSGRPEDEKIVASLELLLEELAALPAAADLRLPSAKKQDANDPTLGRELCGICLHVLANAADTAITKAAEQHLAIAFASHGAWLGDLLDVYVRQGSQSAALSAPTRARLLRSLVDAGLGPLLRSRGHVDAEFVARGFPELLPLASRLLGGDEDGLRTLRQGLELLATILPLGGAAAAAKAGALLDPIVVTALTRVGGDVILQFVPHAATHGTRQIRQLLLDYARGLPLAAAEAAALASVESVDELPRDYLQQVLLAAARHKVEGPLQMATCRLLRAAVERGKGRLTHELYLAAIDNLRYAPEPETNALLRELAKMGLFTCIGQKAREVRLRARATLTALDATVTRPRP